VRAELHASIVAEVHHLGPGNYEYTYTVENAAMSSARFAALAIEKPVGVFGTSLQAPSLWISDLELSNDILGWAAQSELNALRPPGTTTTFRLVTPFVPRMHDYLLVGADLASSLPVVATGVVKGPTLPPNTYDIPGDYDIDGDVDGEDFLIWQRQVGSSVADFEGADGSGNGTVERADLGVWGDNFGKIFRPGDHDGDGDVDGGDFLVWQRQLGLSIASFVGGDGSGDGTVDATDLGVWGSNFGSANSAASAMVVPEPASLSLLFVMFGLVGGHSIVRKLTAQGARACDRGCPSVSGAIVRITAL
jgi:hypothetical protein